MAIPRNLANIAPHVAGSSGGITGLTFNATQSASAGANTLDDYEEGDWTPTLQGSVSNPTIGVWNTQGGKYVKIGRLCWITGIMDFSGFSGGSGDIRIAGLPFTILNENANGGTRGVLGTFGPTWDTNRTVIFCRPIVGQTFMTIVGYGSNQGQTTLSYSTASLTDGDAFYFSLCYVTS